MNFEKGLVAVTGPNGSGKSNILDAIMFAIGENSAKLLRVDKLQSLFHDSQNSNHRLIRVSLTFDNIDRGIPVDSDTVTLTREMTGQNGESEYLLSGKKVSKAAVMELLEVVLAAPNKLNIVQQGMITRISELNSEERRKIIEDIVGLSYFDEKKTESIKQLDEADRRLEVAFARMGEIRKRIDELEAERNNQLRYEQISTELRRLKGIQISNDIRTVKQKLSAADAFLYEKTERAAVLAKQLDELRQVIEKLSGEKKKLLHEAEAANKTKTQVASRISAVVQELERAKAMLGEYERRIIEIERRIPAIEQTSQSVDQRSTALRAEAERLRTTTASRKAELDALRTRLDAADAEIERIGAAIAKYAASRQRLQKRLAKMSTLKTRIELAAATAEEKIKTTAYKKNHNDESLAASRSELAAVQNTISGIKRSIALDRQDMQGAKALVTELGISKEALQRELDSSSLLLARAERLATKFEERASVAENAMNEDFAIADLMKDSQKFGIVGLLRDLVSWNASYERAVLAAGTEWMKAFIVDDMKSMIIIATYAKERRLPRLRIIPLDIIARHKISSDMPADDVNIVGRLSDFVYSKYSKKLAEFLFGDTILTRTSSGAYVLARQGYRAVSVEGELFEPEGGAMSLDFGGRISDLTEAILLANSVEGVRDMLGKLSGTIQKKSLQIHEIEERIDVAEGQRLRLELKIGSLESTMRHEMESVGAKERMIGQMTAADILLQSERSALANELAMLQRRLSLLAPSIEQIEFKMKGIGDESSIKSEIATRNHERSQILKLVDMARISHSEATFTLSSLETRMEIEMRQLGEMQDEMQRLVLELGQKKKHVEELRCKSESLELELKTLRDQEQQIIHSSGDALSVLQEYEDKINQLSENERRTSKEQSAVEREAALLRKDATDLAAEESHLRDDLVGLGYRDLLDVMDVSIGIKELSQEYQDVKARINQLADQAYSQVIDGYRSMSARRNQLENERNSIVSFIQEIEKEKKDVFFEAFQRIDADIRTTFEKMTGGSAWLEIENQDDVFGGGVSLLVRFPNKTVPRESRALSGGEKTIAATVFLLALQSLKPSPFYLMDEVDAHLDAQNTERLSKVLLERSKDNQIIMVTLKDSTVAKASLIYGVYPREGASQVVKYKNPSQVPSGDSNSSDWKQPKP